MISSHNALDRARRSARRPAGRRLSLLLAGLMSVAAVLACGESPTPEAEVERPSTERLLVVGFDRDLPPYSFVDDDGRAAGFSIDLFEAIAEILDVDLAWRPMESPGLLRALEARDLDVIPNLAVTAALDERFTVLIPHSFAGDALFIRSGETVTAEELAEKTLIVRRDDPALERLEKSFSGAQIFVEDTFPDILRRLAAGEGDAAILPQETGLRLARDLGLDELTVTGPPIGQRELSFAIAPGRNELGDELEQALTIVTQTDYPAIYDRWFRPDERLSTREILRRTLWFVVPLLALSLFFAATSWSLRRMVARRTADLEASEERYRGLFASSRDAIALCDLEGRFIDANPACREMLDRTIEDLRARVFQDLTPESFNDEEESALRKLRLGTELSREYEKELCRREGETVPVSVRAWIRQEDDGSPSGYWFLIRDLTEIKATEEERRRIEEKMRQAQKLESLGILAGGIAHDFNNLLMGVLGNANLAHLEASEDSSVKKRLGEIETAARRAAELCGQMLAYSGKGAFMLEPIDVRQLIEEMGHLLEASISKKAELVLDLEAGLPLFKGDRSQIRQVILNLLTNASEALGDTGGRVTIRTGRAEYDDKALRRTFLGDERREGSYVYLEIVDDGCGMDRETRERMFDPFFSTKFTGRGLGLAATLGIVRGHGGTVEVDSELGEGTRFRILFPSLVPRSEAPKSDDSGPTVSLPSAARGSQTVLVAEDERLVSRVVLKTLELAGYRVLEASDGRQTVDIFRQHSEEIDLVLLDMTMPRLSGLEALERLRNISPTVAVIVSSGYSERELDRQFAGREIAGFLQKPYAPDELLELVRNVLDGSPPRSRTNDGPTVMN